MKKQMHRLLSLMLSLILVVGLIPGTMIAHATPVDITEINLTGNYQIGKVPAGILPAFNPGTTTANTVIDERNSNWEYKNQWGEWSGFGSETPVAYNDSKTDYGYVFAVYTGTTYQLASGVKVKYNGVDVTSTAKVSSRFPWGNYVYVDLGKAIGKNPLTHTVTFESNGGKEIAPKKVVSGLKIIAPSTPTKDKYLFRGWYEDSTFSKEFDFNTQITSDMTLYAKWEAVNFINEIRLAGDIQYGNVPVGKLPSFNPRTNTTGASINDRNSGWMERKEATPSWQGFGSDTPVANNDGQTDYGYSFAVHVDTEAAYQLASDLQVFYNGEDVTSSADVIPYVWGAYVIVDLGKANETPVAYTITFNSNGGSEIASKNVNAGEKVSEPTPAPTKEGFTFDGWYEDSTFSKNFDFNTPITHSMTLYAKWEAANSINEIRLVGDVQIGKVPAGILPAFNPGTTTDSITIDRTNSSWMYKMQNGVWSGFGSETPTAVNDGKTDYGYDFTVEPKEGYQLASDLIVIYNDVDVTSTVGVRRWAWGAYVTVDLGKAIGEKPAVTVTFISNGGTEISPKVVANGLKIKEPSTPIKDKYLFRGWYEDSTFSKKFDFNTPITSDVTLYAKWEAANSINEIRLVGDVQNGNVPAGILPAFNPATTTDSITIDRTNSSWMYKMQNGVWSGFGSETPTAVNDGKTDYGYDFAVEAKEGYQLASDLKVIYNDVDVTSTVKVRRYAWGAYVIVDLGKANGTPVVYTITFDANGGSGTMDPVTGLTGEFTLPANKFTAPSGKQFKGWSLTTDGAIVTKVDMTENRTVYAIWENIPVTYYTVTFDSAGGSAVTAQSIEAGQKATKPADPTKDGYDFKGWTLNGSAYDFNTAVNGNITLVATWEQQQVVPTTYTVSFAANGGTGTMADVTGISGEYTLPANGFTAPDGKQFKAWSVGGVEKAVGDKITVTANTTVTAVWEAIEYNVTVTGGTASVGAGTPITKATMGTTVTLTAGAAPTGQMFDKWVVNGVVVADANSATTTFVMPAGNVTAEATYKNAPHTHTFDQEIVKDAALKTAADCTHDAVYYKSCSCGAISTDDTDTFKAINSALGHAWPEEGSWSKDADKHWYECSRCHSKKDEAAHDYGDDDICDICTYDNSVPHTHNLTLVDENPATCTTPGNKAYYTCDGCDKWFEDATGSVDITDKTSVILTANGHTPSDWKSDADNHWKECTRCGDKTELEAHDFGTDNECDICGYKKAAVPSYDDDDDDYVSSTKDKDDMSGRWIQNEHGWWYSYSNGTWPSNGWAYLPWLGSYYWYYFNADGYMAVNWLDWNNNRYNLNPVAGTNAGMMLTGWQQIGGKWYFFNPEKGSLEGILFRNTTTPDGYQVSADGAWIQ